MFIVVLTNFLKLILLDPRFYLATKIKVTFLSTNARAVFRCKKHFSISEFPNTVFSFFPSPSDEFDRKLQNQTKLNFFFTAVWLLGILFY